MDPAARPNHTTNKGNDFRARVCALLRACGFGVTTEIRLGHKKVDALAEKKEYGRLRRYAIECKDYDAGVSKQHSIEIVADYRALKDEKLADDVWVIATSFSADARAHIELSGLRAFSFDELKHVLTDFSTYLAALTDRYRSEEIESFYIPPTTSAGTDIEQFVLEWLETPNTAPIAIEAGYGKGKTTFCYHLSNKLAQLASTRTDVRIPIYVPLGQIAAEQTISGLISDVLALSPSVSNYSFELIRQLNREGSFIF